MLAGGCFCGAVRYETDGVPYSEVNCHCSICRRTSGAPMVAWFSVPKHQFRFTQGVPTRFESSAKGARTFCSQCGTQLTFENRDLPLEIDVTMGSLDQPELVAPKKSIHTDTKLNWMPE